MGSDTGPRDALRRIGQQLVRLADSIDAGATREQLDEAVAGIRAVQRRVFGPRPRAARGAGATQKLLAYLQQHVGEAVSGEELDAISGIQEWPRRIRELRVQEGYEITELGGSMYRLESAQPNAERAAKWQLLNSTRRRPGSAEDRIRALLEARVGEVVTRDDIDYVARIREGIRRVRELRDEEGWPIDSNVDDRTLRPGEYRLLSTDPSDRRDPLQRLYPDDVRERVFKRDNYTCQVCGRNREAALAAGDTRFYLELHHRVAVADEVAELPKEARNDPENLVTLCHSDHLKETAKLQRQKREERRTRAQRGSSES
jgi:biotin operon repressor